MPNRLDRHQPLPDTAVPQRLLGVQIDSTQAPRLCEIHACVTGDELVEVHPQGKHLDGLLGGELGHARRVLQKCLGEQRPPPPNMQLAARGAPLVAHTQVENRPQ